MEKHDVVINDIVTDVTVIIENSKKQAYDSINLILLKRNWLIGKRIYEEELKGKEKAEYGKEIIKTLSNELNKIHGKGFAKDVLYQCLQFYKTYPTIFYARRKCDNTLSWTHYRELIKISDAKARRWYEKESLEANWSYRTLKRNIETQYYYRILKSNNKEIVKKEMIDKTSIYQNKKYEILKNPVIFEFLGIKQDESYQEADFESAIIGNLQKVMLELGKGFAFVGRQYHIHTLESDYYIDLVFYNHILKCFVLIDLKTSKITHQDVGQMDMYVRMFDEIIKDLNDGPTLGIVLCSETSEDIARYSILKGNEQLFASKYKLYLPSENELIREIEYQKELYETRKNKK